MKTLSRYTVLHRRFQTSVWLAFLMLPFAFVGAETIWTGAVSDDWSDPDNWTNGVPSDTNGAILVNPGAGNLDIKFPTGALSIQSIHFTSDATSSVKVARTTSGDVSMSNGDIIVVEAGSGSHTLQIGASSYWRVVGGAPAYVRNNAAGTTLTLIGRWSTVSSTGTGNLIFEGAGNFLMAGSSLFDASMHNVSTGVGFTGTMTIDTNAAVNNNNGFILNGGTLILDGTIRSRASSYFRVNEGAVLTGNGQIGSNVDAKRDIDIYGGTVNAGRIGGTGTLTFVNNNVRFHEGSTVVFDLLNSSAAGSGYDQFVFQLQGEGGSRVLPTIDLVGTTLELNLLEGFAAEINDTFTILDGYLDIVGTFEGLADGDIISVDGFGFQIHYGEHATTLQLVVIPEVEMVSLVMAVFCIFGIRMLRKRR